MMMIGGAGVNALAFSESIVLFASLKSSDAEKERKRHDLALGRLRTYESSGRME